MLYANIQNNLKKVPQRARHIENLIRVA